MYLTWNEKTVTDFSDTNIERMYATGYVFTRKGKGVIQQTRSLRVDLHKFELSSENRRVLARTSKLGIRNYELWDGSFKYDWQIGKMAKDFYNKFGVKTFSANKIKELLTDKSKSNFNTLLEYRGQTSHEEDWPRGLGYAICYQSKNILHYAYPFYSLISLGYLIPKDAKNMGLGMMTRAVVWAKEKGKKYVYLGSASRPSDTYKLQFNSIEWYDGTTWSNDITKLKNVLKV